jgi:hypothetical protein
MLPSGLVRTRSLPSQSENVKYVLPPVPPMYVARCRPPAYTSPRFQPPAEDTSETTCPAKS